MQNRDWLYYTQQTVSAEGFSGQAFSTFVPHTVRARETKNCTDCHVSAARDNNAWMAHAAAAGHEPAQLHGPLRLCRRRQQGFRRPWPPPSTTSREAVIGSDLQRMAYPDDYRKHLERKRELTTAYRHDGNVLDLQLRGEYLYAAMGPAASASSTSPTSTTRIFPSA